MVTTQQKLAWARRAIVELRNAEQNASLSDFQYHFGAFLGLFGALRQLITVNPHKQWIYSMDSTNVFYCTCIDLRNIEVHVNNVVGHPRAEYSITATATIKTTARFEGAVIKVDGTTEPFRSEPEVEHVDGELPQGTQSTTAQFFIDPNTLPHSFAVVLGQKRALEPQEIQVLSTEPCVEIAEKALNYFEHTVLPDAQQQGICIP